MEEEEAMRRAIVVDKANNKDEEQIMLPGFRFHPTDEELVGFYLRRKVERKPLKIEHIRQLDIYKYDPWELPVPKVSCVGEKEYYFFCLRARKYRNSVRPNRVTGSGFWKATGIDKNIYSTTSTTINFNSQCIGLKKSLVYYKGKAGKGTKTDWMMHEFRLPPAASKNSNHHNLKNIITTHQEPEDWTLCRIFKRNTSMISSYKPHLKKITSMKDSLEVENSENIGCRNLQDLALPQKILIKHRNHHDDHLHASQQTSSISVAQSSYSSSNSNFWNLNGHEEFFRDGKWDELSSVVDSVSNPDVVFGYYS